VTGADQPSDQDRLERFIARFDRGEYWLAHEELEPLWLALRDPALKGLIHLAAGLVHAQRRNWAGSRRKLDSGRELMRTCDEVLGLRLAPVRELARALAAQLESVETSGGGFEPDCRPLLAPAYEGTIDAKLLDAVELPYRVRRYEQGYRIGRDPNRRDP
jgi:hypothetical protein